MAAIDVHPDDVWAIHAVVHTFEMRGLVDRGIPFLRDRVDDWGDGNLFTVHNWWHLALFELEAGHHAEVLDIYDRHLHHADSVGVPLEMLDASALLWRLKLDEIDSGDSLRRARRRVGEQNGGRTLVRLQRRSRGDGLRRCRTPRRCCGGDRQVGGRGANRTATSNAMMTSEVGLPATCAVVAFAEDRHDDVVETLAPIRRGLQHFGGSHAQRDVLQRTLLESALRSGRYRFADELVSERLSERPTASTAGSGNND